jgi:hypothetical protein
MSIIATALKHLIAAGVSGDDLVRAVAEMEAAQPASIDRVAEKRRAYDRDRKRKVKRISGGIPVEPVESVGSSPPPNEYISNPPEPCEANASQPPLLEKVVSEWNAGPAANGARRATKLDASRKALLKARLRDHGEAELFAAMANLGASKFHCGENDRGWRANLGWFLEAKNFLKALEMTSGDSAQRQPAKPMTDADRAAYLVKLNDNPMFSASRQAPAVPPRTGNTGPPRAIGDLIHLTGTH